MVVDKVGDKFNYFKAVNYFYYH